jgi:hypothetical protein
VRRQTGLFQPPFKHVRGIGTHETFKFTTTPIRAKV